jgi:RND family efflux transporter MFP subunit
MARVAIVSDNWIVTRILAACALLGSAMLASSCSGTRTVSAKETPEVPAIAVAKATRQDLARELEISAEFRPYQEIDVHAKVAGYLKVIYVDVGDRVREGQILGILEAPEMTEERAQAIAAEKRTEVEVERSRSELQRAESNLHLRKVVYERLSEVAKTRPNLIAQQEIDDATAKYQEAQAQVAVAKATLAAMQEQTNASAASRARVDTMLRYLRVTAPFAGIITRRYADTGAMIQAGTASQTQAMPVVRLAEIDRLRLILPVPESIVSRVHDGAPVEVRVDSLSRSFEGRVARFTGELDPSTRTMSTEVDVENPAGVLKPGMFAFATITVDEKPDALAIPVQGIAKRGNGSESNVWVVNKDGRLESRTIRTGIETPDKVEILAGLHEGDLVVVGRRPGMAAGQQVQAKLNVLAVGAEN